MTTVTTKDTSTQSNFAYRAKVALLQRGLNIALLARQLDVARTTASQAINHGLHEPTRLRIASYLNIKP